MKGKVENSVSVNYIWSQLDFEGSDYKREKKNSFGLGNVKQQQKF